MKKISTQSFFIFSAVFIFLAASLTWYLILYQTIGFFTGLVILTFLIFLAFWQNFLAFRRAGELIGLKTKRQIFSVSIVLALGFSELIWGISFMPFSFFVLGGALSVIFAATLDIFKEYFKESTGDNFLNKILTRDITAGVVLITIFIFISSWLPPRAL